MHIRSIQLRQLRIIESAELEPSPGVNLIVGNNASGKTSFLESIDLLSRGRSFRSARPDELIRSGCDACQVVARVENRDQLSRLGIERRAGTTRARIDGQDAGALAELARRLAAVVMEPLSVSLVSGAPSERRSFLDWGVFHHAESFLANWQRYGRLLGQRNSLLKRGVNARTLAAIDRQLVEEAESLTALRLAYLAALEPEIESMAGSVLGAERLKLQYRQGWAQGEALAESLSRRLDTDKERGFTGAGPHRADLEITLDGDSVARIASRGQQKAVVAVLKLAQARLFSLVRMEPPVLLLDDVASELDREHRAGVLRGALALGGQVFLTAIEEGAIDLPGGEGGRMFHVEHGRLQELV